MPSSQDFAGKESAPAVGGGYGARDNLQARLREVGRLNRHKRRDRRMSTYQSLLQRSSEQTYAALWGADSKEEEEVNSDALGVSLSSLAS